jgi:hypothetical protein
MSHHILYKLLWLEVDGEIGQFEGAKVGFLAEKSAVS